MRVLKAGGTSMATAHSIGLVAELYALHPDNRYIVVSAPGRVDGQPKITWLLSQALIRPALRGAFLYQVRTRYADLAQTLGVAWDLDGLWQEFLTGQREDALLALGEHLAAHLVAKAWNIPFLDAREGIVFDGDKLDEQATYCALRALAARYERGVMGGFFGCDREGQVRLLPKGGSDVSGALLAAALNADEYQNWTDVDGIYTDDPHVVPTARPIERISYRQAYAMSAWGAQVLHPMAIAPCERRGIPIRIANTFCPAKPGTRIEVQDKWGSVGLGGGVGYVLLITAARVDLPFALDCVDTGEETWVLLRVSDAFRAVLTTRQAGGIATLRTVAVLAVVGNVSTWGAIEPLYARWRWRDVATLYVVRPSQFDRARARLNALIG